MNSRSNAAQWLEAEISNAGAPPPSEEVPPLEEDSYMEKTPVHPPLLKDGDIKASLIQLAQAGSVEA